MEKVVRKGIGRTRIGEAIIPCDTTPNTRKTFDTPLVAKLGETVFFLKPEFSFQDNNGEITCVIVNEIIKGTVRKIDCATDCATCINIEAYDGEDCGAMQELFFHSFEAAAEVAAKVNEYTKNHPIWEGDWYKIYKGLFQPTYTYTLKFPILPLQTQKVWKRNKWHYIIPNRVIADIEEGRVDIHYQGRDTKPEYYMKMEILGSFRRNFSKEYEIVPASTNN